MNSRELLLPEVIPSMHMSPSRERVEELLKILGLRCMPLQLSTRHHLHLHLHRASAPLASFTVESALSIFFLIR